MIIGILITVIPTRLISSSNLIIEANFEAFFQAMNSVAKISYF